MGRNRGGGVIALPSKSFLIYILYGDLSSSKVNKDIDMRVYQFKILEGKAQTKLPTPTQKFRKIKKWFPRGEGSFERIAHIAEYVFLVCVELRINTRQSGRVGGRENGLPFIYPRMDLLFEN